MLDDNDSGKCFDLLMEWEAMKSDLFIDPISIFFIKCNNYVKVGINPWYTPFLCYSIKTAAGHGFYSV